MVEPLFQGKHVHLMGIGGAGMSALVPLLQRAGAMVSGCDLGSNALTKRFVDEGLTIFLGHASEHVDDCDILVHTSAVAASHDEVRTAAGLGCLILSRQACLAELLKPQRTIAVAGSHGKTSTTWMLGHLMMAADLDPVVLVGGTVAPMAGGAHVGQGEWAVVEVDESDGGFTHTDPSVSIVTNLEAEHTDHYGSFSGLCTAFAHWLASIPAGGQVICPVEGVPEAALRGIAVPICRVGLDEGDVHAADLELAAEGSRCQLMINGEPHGEMVIPIPGKHMVHNALMAAAAMYHVHCVVPTAALAKSGRVGRRFTNHPAPNGLRVIEDYAHHPTEIMATLAAASLGGGRLHCIFQPHRYTRTRDLMAEFAPCFDAAQAVVIVPTYAASEEPLAGADAASLAAAVRKHRSAQRDPALTQYARQWQAAISFIQAHAQAGDTILVLGAGDIGDIVPNLLEQLA
jgi:UDP-N-acetylmuramate--alanine ligase